MGWSQLIDRSACHSGLQMMLSALGILVSGMFRTLRSIRVQFCTVCPFSNMQECRPRSASTTLQLNGRLVLTRVCTWHAWHLKGPRQRSNSGMSLPGIHAPHFPPLTVAQTVAMSGRTMQQARCNWAQGDTVAQHQQPPSARKRAPRPRWANSEWGVSESDPAASHFMLR